MHAAPRVFTLVLALALAACTGGSAPSLSAVRLDMTTAEVEKAGGTPLDVVTTACGPNSPTYYVYAGDRDHMTSFVHFVGGRVVEVVERGRSLTTDRAAMALACVWP